MGGFLGIGGSSAKTDRADQLTSTQEEFQIYNYGLPTGKTTEAIGQNTLNEAQQTLKAPENYFQNLLTAGRTQTAATAAPAVNEVLAQSDAARKQSGNFGTQRTGGTAALNDQSGTAAQSQIDNIINQTLQTGKKEGAAGLESVASKEAAIGGTEISNAMSLLGLSDTAIDNILQNATQSRQISNQMNLQTQEQWGQLAGTLLLGAA